MWNSDNPFLRGNFAPWRVECDARDLVVEGELPRELRGTLYRNGPNPHFKPRGRYHWFDGDGMVHAFILDGGCAHYRNRYVRTAGLGAETRAGRALYGGLLSMDAEPPPGEPPFKNAGNTNIIGYADRLLALWEAGLPHELRPGTLETVGTYDFGGRLAGPMTAHPKFDPPTGDLLFFGYQPFPPYVTWYRADRAGELLESRDIGCPLPVMMHDFATTERHAIFFVCPSVFRFENLAQGKPPLVWEPQHGTRIGVMERATGAVRWFETGPCYIFHFLNAYEDGDRIVVDACRYDSLDMTGTSFGVPPFPCRFTLDLLSGAVRENQTDDTPSEFPRIDDRLNGRRHRYGYFASSPREADAERRLIRHDYATGRFESKGFGRHMAPMEPVFVPRRSDAPEDDGYVLGVWYNAESNTSELIVQDAADFAGEPVAKVKLQHRVPFGFHGNWVPG